LTSQDSGYVFGRSDLSAFGAYDAFVWTVRDGMIDLGTLGGECSWPFDISNDDQVVGFACTGSGDPHAFSWTARVEWSISVPSVGVLVAPLL